MKANQVTSKISQEFPAVGVDSLQDLRRFMRDSALALGAGSDQIHDMIVASNEAITNIIEHGYAGQAGIIKISVSYAQGELRIILKDNAPLYDPTQVPVPDVTQPLEQRRPGGMGVHMMREYTTSLRYRVANDGCNELILVSKKDEANAQDNRGE